MMDHYHQCHRWHLHGSGKQVVFVWCCFHLNFFQWLICFIRQSTCLIRVENLVILTDPVFTRCTINDHLGPKRLRPIPCTLEEIQPYLDIVLVSHDHFDHLGNMMWCWRDSIVSYTFLGIDQQVVTKLGNAVTWYVPLGLRQWFVKRGIENVSKQWEEKR